MKLEASKLAFLKEFLQRQSKEAVERLQHLLQEEKQREDTSELHAITPAILNKRLAKKQSN